MRTFAEKPKATQQTTSAKFTVPGRGHFGQSREVDSILYLQRTIGNQAVQRLLEKNMGDVKEDSTTTETARFGHDFSRIPVPPRAEAKAIASEQRESLVLEEKSVDGESDSLFGIIQENGTDGGVGPKDAGAPAAGVPKKKAGVDSFKVEWKKNANASPTTAKLRLDYSVKFKKDAVYDPASAEFRQNVMTKWEVTAGPRKGESGDTSPMHDDHYSRADDTGGNTINDENFVSNDSPGFTGSVDKEDVVDYSFTAEQMIIDTGDGNKVIAKRGPHTGTIKGKDPRSYAGVPITLS